MREMRRIMMSDFMHVVMQNFMHRGCLGDARGMPGECPRDFKTPFKKIRFNIEQSVYINVNFEILCNFINTHMTRKFTLKTHKFEGHILVRLS
jgi:hypothetical protein